MNSPIKKVAIVGGSSAGLLSAVTLKYFFPQLEIDLFYSKKVAPIGVGESTTAWIPQFVHECLKIPRKEFYQSVYPVWKLGIRFEWGSPTISHFNYTFDNQFRQQSTLLSRETGFYCVHDMQRGSPFSILMDKGHSPLWVDEQKKMNIRFQGFGYHLGISELINFLEKKALSLGVNIQPLQITGGKLDNQGNIEALYGENNFEIVADLFIDCSGFKSKLLGGLLQENFKSFSHRLFCDSAIVGEWVRESPILPYTTVTTMPSGWRWRIDLQNRVSFGYVYSSQFCDQNQAIEEYIQVTPEASNNLKCIGFKSGRYQRFWVNNVVAIGNASGFVEPLESTGQHMIIESIWRLVLALQDSNLCPSNNLKQATNQYIGDQWDEICDFLSLHFKFNDKLDTPFWQHCRQKTDLGSIQTLVNLYQDSGICRILAHYIPQSSIFEIDGYLSLLCGQKVSIKNLPQISSTEKEEWNTYRQSLDQQLQYSLGTKEAFDFLDKQVWG